MLHPSYAELIKAVNGDTEGDTPVVNSRYSIVLATAKRARQLIDGRKPLSSPAIDKPLSIAVDELSKGLIKIETEEEQEEMQISELSEETEESGSLTEEIVDDVTDELAEEQIDDKE